MKNIILLYNDFLSCITVSCRLLLYDLVASRLVKYVFIHCELGQKKSSQNSDTVNIYHHLNLWCLETTGSNYRKLNLVGETS